MKALILCPMSSSTQNIIRDVLYGCWCKGKRIGGATVPPFNLLVLTAFLRREGFDVDFLDAQVQRIPPEAVKSRMGDYRLVAVLTSMMSFKEDAKYLASLKADNKDLITAVFGSHPTFLPTYSLNHAGVDLSINHEPEFIMRDLLTRLKNEQSYTDLKGIGYKTKEGKMVVNPPYPFIEDLDVLPFPNVDLLPKNENYYNPLVKDYPYITTSTSRGCPASCTFCTAPYFDGNITRFNSADYVWRQMEYFAGKGMKEVYFRDDTFFVDKKRDHTMCRRLIDSGIKLSWIANARINMIDESTITLAKKAGCDVIKFGVESGVQQILDNLRKGYKIEKAYKVFKWCHDAGVKTHAHVMFGNPGDTRDTILRTIDYILELDPTTIDIGICTPYPGTPLFEEVRKKFPEIADGTDSDLTKLHTEGVFNKWFCEVPKKELSYLQRYAYRRFYARPYYWLKTIKEQISSVSDLKRVGLAASRVLDFGFRNTD